jgi:hypothetical protein
MKQLFLAVLAAAALGTSACAQNPSSTAAGGPPAGPAGPSMAAGPMGERLNLTPDQRQKIQPIMRSTMTQMRSIMDDAHNRELAALSSDHRTKVQQIITQASAAMQRAMPAMPPPGANVEPPHGKGRFSALRQQHQQFISQIDAVLSPSESQAVLAIGNDAHSKATSLHQSAISQIKPLLSADQAKTLDQMPMRGHFGMGKEHTPDAGAYLLMGAMKGHMRPEMHP